MTDPADRATDARTPVIPGWVSAVSIVVAVLAMSALVWVLFKGTVGPGETVRGVYDAVAAGDCAGAWEALAPGLQGERDEGSFCDDVSDAAGSVPSGVHVQKVTLLGDEGEATRAEVSMQEDDATVVWGVEREGHDWSVTSLPDSGVLSGL